MDFRTEPVNLQIKDINVDICPCCNMILQQNIRKGCYLIRECGYCRYLDRPFGGCGNRAKTHYGGECSCEYGEKDYLYISCEKCKYLKCIDCKEPLSCRNENCAIPIRCFQCCKKYEFNNKWKNTTPQQKLEFNNKWENTTPQQKLELYGIQKLKILAKNKKIKGFSKYKKQELINILLHLVDETDFPIK
jgi:hypothetical protein